MIFFAGGSEKISQVLKFWRLCFFSSSEKEESTNFGNSVFFPELSDLIKGFCTEKTHPVDSSEPDLHNNSVYCNTTYLSLWFSPVDPGCLTAHPGCQVHHGCVCNMIVDCIIIRNINITYKFCPNVDHSPSLHSISSSLDSTSEVPFPWSKLIHIRSR